MTLPLKQPRRCFSVKLQVFTLNYCNFTNFSQTYWVFSSMIWVILSSWCRLFQNWASLGDLDQSTHNDQFWMNERQKIELLSNNSFLGSLLLITQLFSHLSFLLLNCRLLFFFRPWLKLGKGQNKESWLKST